MTGKVYLAGPILRLSYSDATQWRTYVTAQIAPLEALSPMRAKEFLAGCESIPNKHEDHVLNAPSGIITRDRFDV